MFCARLFICALWSPAGKGLTSWLSFVVSSVSLSLSHWYPGSGVVLDCIDSWSLHHYLLLKRKPYYRIIEKRGPVSYIIKNQLDGVTSKVQAEMWRKANVDNWRISKDANGKRLRDADCVIPPEASESESESDSDLEDNVPLARMIKKHRQERETSEDEDDIPLMELRKKLNYRELR